MVLIKRMLFQWRQRNAQDVHSMLSKHTHAHTHAHSDAHTEISSDRASSGIWHTEKNGMLGLCKARWEAGSNSGLCLSDVKWLLTEGLLMVVCGIKGSFREPSKLLLNTASNYYSGRSSVFVSSELLLIIPLIGILSGFNGRHVLQPCSGYILATRLAHGLAN